MNKWKDYSLVKKIVIGIIIAILAFASPEIMIILDFSGIELTVSFLLVYYKSTISMFQHKYKVVKDFMITTKNSIFNKHLLQPKLYLIYSICSIGLLLISGSLVLSLSIFLLDGAYSYI